MDALRQLRRSREGTLFVIREGVVLHRLQKYFKKIVPLKGGIVSLNPWLSFMQDNALAHACDNTMEELREGSMILIHQPSIFPDLKLIEAVWGLIKDFIQRNHPNLDDGRQRTHNSRREIVTEVQHSLPTGFLIRLLEELPARYQAVIDTGGSPADNELFITKKISSSDSSSRDNMSPMTQPLISRRLRL